MFYAGVGARKTPEVILTQMTALANLLECQGFILRSGGANGADAAFERGVGRADRKEIYLPWAKFNDNPSHLHLISSEAYAMAEKYHPYWKGLSTIGRKFHARNCYQLFGYNLEVPVQFVLCWTPEARTTGGTGQAIRIARAHDIPVFNMGAKNWKHAFDAWMDNWQEFENIKRETGPNHTLDNCDCEDCLTIEE